MVCIARIYKKRLRGLTRLLCIEMGFQDKYFSKGEMGCIVGRKSRVIGKPVCFSDFSRKDIKFQQQGNCLLLNNFSYYWSNSIDVNLLLASSITSQELYALSDFDYFHLYYSAYENH